MGNRYNNSSTIINDEEIYEEFREERNTKKITHYATPEFPYLSISHRLNISRVPHLWKAGDRYWKLAAKYYKEPSLWWLIAWFNQKPTESHISVGETILIPKPVSKILQYYNTRR